MSSLVEIHTVPIESLDSGNRFGHIDQETGRREFAMEEALGIVAATASQFPNLPMFIVPLYTPLKKLTRVEIQAIKERIRQAEARMGER
jgi:hypothetical protein